MPVDISDRLHRASRRFELVDVLERWLPTRAARIIAWARSDEALSTAGGLAFFGLVASIPALLIALWLAGSVVGFDPLLSAVTRLTSSTGSSNSQGAEYARRIIDVAERLGWGSILAAIWPATTYGAGLARAFDRLTPQRRRPLDGIRGRFLGAIVVAALPVVVLSSLALVVVAPSGDAGLVIGTIGSGILAFLVVAVITALLYHLFSPVDVGPGASARGGAVSSALTLAASLGFAIYLRLGGNEQQYASSTVALVVLGGLWLYLVNAAVIIGYKAALQHAGAAAWADGRWSDSATREADSPSR